MAVKVPAEVTREELEAAFPWVCHLPPAAIGEFMCAVEIYRDSAEIYSGQRQPDAFHLIAEDAIRRMKAQPSMRRGG